MNIKNHPFAVAAHFERSIVLAYAIEKEELQSYIPTGLELDTFKDKWAFVALAMVQTKELRPKGFPSIVGRDFFLIGYRVFVRYKDKRGKSLRGLYILKSETDNPMMSFFGNMFTHYNYTTTDVCLNKKGQEISIYSEKSNLDVVVDIQQKDVELPDDSPFSDWKEARRFAGPLPFTFTYNDEKKEMLIIEGVRQNWKPAPIHVAKAEVGFLMEKDFNTINLANAFMVSDIPYYWKKGKIEKWT